MGRHVLLSLLLLFLSLVVFDSADASFGWEHRKLANSGAEDNNNAKKDSPVPKQENLVPKNKSTNDNQKDTTTEEKGSKGSSNNSHKGSSPASAPLPSGKGLNATQAGQNREASPSVTEGVGKGNGKGGGKGNEEDGGKEGSSKDGGKEGDGKDGGKEGNGKEGGKEGNGKDGGDKGNAKDGGKKSNGKEDGNGNGKDGAKGNGNEGKTVSQSNTAESCGERKTCNDKGGMVGCISKLDPTYVVILLHNGGTDAIKVKLNGSNLEDIEVDKQQTKEVNISTSGERTELIFNAGKGDCVLPIRTPVPKGGEIVMHLPSYDKILTPVNGAYFLILTVLAFGGTWACCKFRKKRQNEVPYQELEMAMPETAALATTNVESVEGWDQVWDDDWDDDVAVKSPATHPGSISANGLTSRSSNKDGWEGNWDD